jgi:thiamine kinase-like enzyme
MIASQVLTQFLPETGFQLKAISNGLINESYSVALSEEAPAYFLQRINTSVFKSPILLQQNYQTIRKQLMQAHSRFVLPAIITTASKQLLATDEGGHSWRMFQFVKDAQTKQHLQHEDDAYEVAQTFGRFTSDLRHTSANSLPPVLPGFHNITLRYQQLRQAIAQTQPQLLKTASDVLNGLEKFSSLLKLYQTISQTAGFGQYVLHHDAKISNIIFGKDGKVITPIDMDTTMPGYFFSDAGDMYRSMAANANEEEWDTNSMAIRKNFYAAITEGYLGQVSAWFTSQENEQFHASGLLLSFMQCIRFITDFLNGDVYYKVQYPHQNLYRAANQLALLRAMAAHVKANYHFNI